MQFENSGHQRASRDNVNQPTVCLLVALPKCEAGLDWMQGISRQMGPRDSERSDQNLCHVSNTVSGRFQGLEISAISNCVKNPCSREGYAKGNAKGLFLRRPGHNIF